jgi:hypothetical protein
MASLDTGKKRKSLVTARKQTMNLLPYYPQPSHYTGYRHRHTITTTTTTTTAAAATTSTTTTTITTTTTTTNSIQFIYMLT